VVNTARRIKEIPTGIYVYEETNRPVGDIHLVPTPMWNLYVRPRSGSGSDSALTGLSQSPIGGKLKTKRKLKKRKTRK
jgi:hypothetical protein